MGPYYGYHFYRPGNPYLIADDQKPIQTCIICGTKLGPIADSREVQKMAYPCVGDTFAMFPNVNNYDRRKYGCEVLRCGQCLEIQKDLEFMSCDQWLRNFPERSHRESGGGSNRRSGGGSNRRSSLERFRDKVKDTVLGKDKKEDKGKGKELG